MLVHISMAFLSLESLWVLLSTWQWREIENTSIQKINIRHSFSVWFYFSLFDAFKVLLYVKNSECAVRRHLAYRRIVAFLLLVLKIEPNQTKNPLIIRKWHHTEGGQAHHCADEVHTAFASNLVWILGAQSTGSSLLGGSHHHVSIESQNSLG